MKCAIMDWRTLLKRALLVCIWFIPLTFLMIWLPVAGASAHEVTTVDTPPTGTTAVQDTPTVDATVIALQKEQLAEQVEQLQVQNAWSTWTNLATPLTVLIGALTIIGGAWRYVVGQRTEREKQRELEKQQLADKQAEREKKEEEQQRWLEDRKIEREKQAEARFQKVVEGLGSSSEAAQVGSAILLRTFVRKDEGNERFYAQAFDLAVAHLRLRHIDPDTPEPLTPLSRALIIALKESYPLAHDCLNQTPQALDATGIQLDNAYLVEADLDHIRMPGAHLRGAELFGANLFGADLSEVNLSGTRLSEADLRFASLSKAYLNKAYLGKADLSGAFLWDANFSEASLIGTNLSRTSLWNANLSGASLWNADLSGADLSGANLSGTGLSGVNLSGVNLSDTNLSGAFLYGADLSEVNLSGATLHNVALDGVKSLRNTNLRRVKGLTTAQLKACQARGAIIDDDIRSDLDQFPVPTTSAQSQDHQTQASPAQRSVASTIPSQNEDDASPSPGES